ncbi:MAG: MFS transporter [Anaerolineae bacterium]
MTAGQASFLRERPYMAVAITHFFVDVLNSGKNLLVAVLALSIGLTNTQVGLALLLYNVGSSLSQPLFGWLADKAGPRWLVIGGMGWMMAFYSVAALAGDWVALLALTVAGLGSGAFHPTGTMVASQKRQGQRARATAVFFMAGQLGLFAGPVLTGMLLHAWGRPGYIVLPLLSFMAFLSGWQWLVDRHLQRETAPKLAAITSQKQEARPSGWRLQTVLLAIIIVSVSTVSVAAMSFSPKLFAELGFAEDYIGWLSGLFMLGSAVGGVTGGALADRIPGKWVIVLGTMGAALPVYFYIPTPGLSRFLLLFIAGFFNGMPHSILIIKVQTLLPNRQALASGLALGFMFFSGSIGSSVLGVIADNVGLGLALQGTAVLPLIGLLAAISLSQKEQT